MSHAMCTIADCSARHSVPVTMDVEIDVASCILNKIWHLKLKLKAKKRGKFKEREPTAHKSSNG